MRNEPNLKLEQYRVSHPALGPGECGKNYGYFEIGVLRILSSGSGDPECDGWEHVSVSTFSRVPTWAEMCMVKELFWRDDETVVQFHPKKSEYVNKNQFCLHLWKRIDQEFELPRMEMV